jgi:hypothetical protein
MSISSRDPDVAKYIEQRDSEAQALINALRTVVFEAEPKIEEAIKWKRITFTVNGNWHHWICGIEQTKKHISLMFHKGVFLEDPAGVLQGTGNYTRQIRFTSLAQLDESVLVPLIKQAVVNQLRMLDSTSK